MHAPVALVTGASRGIGRAVAIALARDGYDCIATCRDRSDLADSLAAEIRDLGRTCWTARFDVADGAAAAAVLQPTLDISGPPAVLVNNAGRTRDGLMALMPESDWTDVLGTSLGGFFNVTRLTCEG